jgi:hypothetical protein
VQPPTVESELDLRTRGSVGRMLRITSRVAPASGEESGSGRLNPPNRMLPSSTFASTRFIDGEPINAATNRFAGRRKRVCGVSTCCMIPSRSTATRCPSVIASIWSCVTYTVVTPRRSCSFASSARIDTRSLASRFESGSSIKKAFGSRTIARPMATRWRCPPDSLAGLRSSSSSRPSVFATSCTRRVHSRSASSSA